MNRLSFAAAFLALFCVGSNATAECKVNPDLYEISYQASECQVSAGDPASLKYTMVGAYWFGETEGVTLTCPISYTSEFAIETSCSDGGEYYGETVYQPGYTGTAKVLVSVVDNNDKDLIRCVVLGVDGRVLYGTSPYLFDFRSAGSDMTSITGVGIDELAIPLSGLSAARTQYLNLICFLPAKPKTSPTHLTISNPSGIAGYSLVVEP